MNAVRFTPTFEDTLAAYRLAIPLNWRRIAAYSVFSIGVVAEVGSASHAPLEAIAIGCAAALAVSAAVFCLGRVVLLPRRIRRLYDQQASLSAEYTVWADDAGLHVRTEHTSSDAPYHHFIKRRQNAAVILLYQSDAMFQFLPRRLLTDEQSHRLEARLADIPLRR